MITRFNIFAVSLICLFFALWFNGPDAKAQAVSPGQAVITVNGIPSGIQGLAIEIMIDTSVVKISSSATSNVSGGLVVTGSMSEGIGIIATKGDLPTSLSLTVPLIGLAEGTSSVSIGQVLDKIGGTPISGAIANVDIDSVDVSNAFGTYMLIGDGSTVVAPGSIAAAFSFTGAPPDLSATLNGSMVDFISEDIGVAIVKITPGSEINLNLAVKSGSQSGTISIGSFKISPGSGKPPKINSAKVQNKPSVTSLLLTGQKLDKENTVIQLVPVNRTPSSAPVIMGAVLKATYDPSECIPAGTYVNLSTLGGTAAKKIKARGSCSNGF